MYVSITWQDDPVDHGVPGAGEHLQHHHHQHPQGGGTHRHRGLGHCLCPLRLWGSCRWAFILKGKFHEIEPYFCSPNASEHYSVSHEFFEL